MCRFSFLTFVCVLSLPLLRSPVLGSTLVEESDAPKTSSSLRVTVLGRATCQSLENRVLMMVKIENEAGDSHIKPFYRSSGINSGSVNTHFPFENLSGRFGEMKFTQFYVEKVHLDLFEHARLRPLMVGAGTSLAPRFGNLLYARVSALLEGGFWDTQDGIESKCKMDVVGSVAMQEGESVAFQTSAEIRNWMRSFDYHIKPGLVFSNQHAYARFSYEVLLTLTHRLDGGMARNSLKETYRQLCLRIKDKVRPEALALLVPGFQEDYSLRDYSRYVDENISLKQWRKHSVAFLPISINFYKRGLVSEAIGNDMAVFRQMKFVKENKLPYIPHEPMSKMNLIIERFLAEERFTVAHERRGSKEPSRANTFYAMPLQESLHDSKKNHAQECLREQHHLLG
ncbi:MAG: hypothetical protein K2X53_04180 [Alphaproteobacteria bacterium]|nr:hypothetical protein [Alphaproteobacteria bacterium]